MIKRIKELRQRHGWSAERLAEEMKRVGFPWGRQTVTKLENDSRASISVQEMFALAYVLDVAPVHLVVPVEDVTYAPLPGQNMHPQYVRAWIRGERPLGEQDPRIFYSEVPENEFQVEPIPPELREQFGKRMDEIKQARRGDDAGR